ncbi:glutathione peroxidase [Algoriphagus namhaensis]|uniref:Glutathione peroxidase n=1 Tax=Algoriphagus namhaensis TaxID=915353 RepID=A0ABV8AU78_9BACT
MKKLGLIYLLLFAFACQKPVERPETVEASIALNPNTMESMFYDFEMKDLNGEMVKFSSFKGKKILVVNVASKCGYTPQYEGLQELYKNFSDKVVILGFPANNFGGQEPGSNEEIKEFCTANYGVTFPVFEKISVKGFDKHPIYRWLSDPKQNGWNSEEPSWNFCKYLLDEKGELLKYYPSSVSPLDEDILKLIES